MGWNQIAAVASGAIALVGAICTAWQIYQMTVSDAKARGLKHPKFWGFWAMNGNNSSGLLMYLIGRRKYPIINMSENNAKELEKNFPCEIQKHRLENIGKYRGQIQIEDDQGEKLDLSNVFTIGAYAKEIQQILDTQKKYHAEIADEFCEKYLKIFTRKRKYYEGPGNEKSRTDYGKYTTRLAENGEYITEKNIFEKLIGKCSVYKDELRAASASYTAQEFNLLNDLNNLTVNGRKLEENEKHLIVDKVKASNTINMRKIIADAMGEKIEEFYGARIDKSEKEIFHKFEVYNKSPCGYSCEYRRIFQG